MRRSIVPEGFESLAHEIFRNYSDPLPAPFLLRGSSDCTNESSSPSKSDAESETSDLGITVRCPICLQSVLDPVTLLGCNHLFCKECITKWFQTKIECPLCKISCHHFIQSCDEKEEQFHLWQTALAEGSSSKLSLSSAARQAMKVHKSHKLGVKNRREYSLNSKMSIEGVTNIRYKRKYLANKDCSTKVLQASSRAPCHQEGETSTESVEKFNLRQESSDDSTIIDYLGNNLQAVCEELRQLEDDLCASYAN
jgi:hypothetical protein